LVLGVLFGSWIAGCGPRPGTGAPGDETFEPGPAGRAVASVPLIPRQVLFGNPDRSAARISPDGARLSWLAPVDGVMNVWVAPVDDVAAARPVTRDTVRGVRTYFWTYTNRHLVYLQDAGGDENWHVYLTDVETEETEDLTPIEGVRAEIQGVSHLFPEEILVGLNDRDPSLHDIHRLNLLTGERALVQRNDGFLGFVTDDRYEVRFAQRMTEDGGVEILAPGADGEWETFLRIGQEDSLTTNLLGFDKTGRTVYLLDSRERDTAALATLSLDDGTYAVVAEDARADVSSLLAHPTEKTIQAAAFEYDRTRWIFLDDAVRADFEALGGVARGDVEVVSGTLDDRVWIVAFMVDDGPVPYYLWDREAKEARFLFTNRRDLEGLPLVRMEPLVLEARDGLPLVSYLSLPPGSDADGDGRPESPVPLVLYVHGGPWSRESWGYSAMDQWLANRGYAMLSVNFRGSTGFGKAFVNAGDGEWAGKAHDDLIDAVAWAVAEGIAQPDRVAILGGSYGGYAALVGLTFTPDVFACAVDIVGPSNLVTLLESIPPYWAPMIEMFATRVGDHRTEAGRALLMERSPLTRVDAIGRPLLIGQGANDPRVKQAESDQIVAAMTERGIPVTYVLYPDEGHGFARPENRISFFAVTEAFLAAHLGGRFERVGADFGGASITVPHGAEAVPGLASALGR
jgi:dipeptidyl aminopeptidase/acylaminoacyl peptidase